MSGGSALRQQLMLETFVAGVCDSDRGPGGWGAVLLWGAHSRELFGAELAPTTGERMLLKAAIEALNRLKRPESVILHADRAVVDRHLDLRSLLASAARPHDVVWRGVISSGPEDALAVTLARRGLLDALQKLDSRCVHDLITRQCWQCRPKFSSIPDRVAVTAGGAVYHLSEDCGALRDGCRSIERRGGVRAELNWVPTVDALAAGRGACEVCCAGRNVR
jgi:ribonuclease HI